MTNASPPEPHRALVAELIVAGLLLGYGAFSVQRLVLLLLLASQSLWARRRGWADLGLRRPTDVRRTLLLAVSAALAILVVLRVAIAPLAVWIAGEPIDLSALGAPGDLRSLARWLAQAWTLAAFGEEMIFRGYLPRRVVDLVGDTGVGWTIAIVTSSALFGLAHHYQGWAGVVATGVIGGLLGLLYLLGRRNLWTVIVCHALVDTVALLAIYSGHESWLIG